MLCHDIDKAQTIHLPHAYVTLFLSHTNAINTSVAGLWSQQIPIVYAQTKGVGRRNNLTRENSGSEVDLVDGRHMVLEVHHVVED